MLKTARAVSSAPLRGLCGVCIGAPETMAMICIGAALSLGAIGSPFPIPTKTVAPGVEMPVLMIGTGASHNYEVVPIVKGWMALGGRGVDTAWDYKDQVRVAQTIESAGVARADVFLTSKVPGCPDYNATTSYVLQDLAQLNTTYLDLVLIHYPQAQGCQETWRALEALHDGGTLKSIGVSNFGVGDLERLRGAPPVVNQIPYSVYEHDERLIACCRARGITVQSYSPLKTHGGKSIFSDPTIGPIATRHGVSPPQVVLRWILQRGGGGDIATFLSGNMTHQASDADVFAFSLSDDDIAKLDGIQGAGK